jgi:hypothetical protein
VALKCKNGRKKTNDYNLFHIKLMTKYWIWKPSMMNTKTRSFFDGKAEGFSSIEIDVFCIDEKMKMLH